MAKQETNYKQGHSASTVANHAIRTVDTDAAFVLAHIKPTDCILDIGCGPGTITTGFARYAARGSVVGIDISDGVLQLAARTHAAGAAAASSSSADAAFGTVSFAQADVLAGLPFDDGRFDVVFTSQLFPHLTEEMALRALREMRRVLRPGGLLATRDATELRWYPARLGLDEVMGRRMLRGLDAEEWPGGEMPARLRAVGFAVDADGSGPAVAGSKMQMGLGTTVHFGPEARGCFASGLLGRLEEGDEYRKSWTGAGITESEIEETAAALRLWAATEDAWYMSVHTEILAWN